MRQYKTCLACKNKYDIVEFETVSDVICKACSLIGRRLLKKFNEMVASTTNGLSDLNTYLDQLYVME